MTPDQQIAAVGVGVGIVGVVVAAWAAVYATRAFRSGERASTTADLRWGHQIKPRPTVGIQGSVPAAGSPAPATISLHAGNLGGSMADGFVLVGTPVGLYSSRLTVAQHTTAIITQAQRIESATARDPAEIMLLVARDIEGGWWDCLKETKIAHPPLGPVGSDAFNDWANAWLNGQVPEETPTRSRWWGRLRPR